jgi:hydrogenase-4 component F
MILALLLVPALAGLLALAIRGDRLRRGLLVAAAAAHSALSVAACLAPPPPLAEGWLLLDPLGRLLLAVTSILFLAAAVYGVNYLRSEAPGRREDFQEGLIFTNAPEAVFTGCLLLFLATMTLACVSHHLGLLWVAIEATTLASAPLIYFHRHRRSLEATWKYLLVCSVGIALALFGNFLLAVAASGAGREQAPLLIGDLAARGPALDPAWLKAAFLFLVVGYGTKMGLAPLHTWLPDAHSEAPSVVSALLSGALLNCAFLAILRVEMVCGAAGIASWAEEVLVVLGLLSMATAAVFIAGQPDYKRMLAYSSVEHMGILALGVGLGGAATYGALLHAVNHSLAKGLLFLAAGNILAAYRTKSVPEVRGVLRVLPATGVLWIAGFLAIAGSPPFGPFLSEITILKAAIDGGHGWIAAAYVLLLAAVFVGMSITVLGMAQGWPPGTWERRRGGEALLSIAPIAALAALVLILGLYVPPAVSNLIRAAARDLGGP